MIAECSSAPSRDKNLLKVQSRETQLLAFGATEREGVRERGKRRRRGIVAEHRAIKIV